MKDKTIKLNDVFKEIDTLREHYLNSLKVSDQHNLMYSVANCQAKLDLLHLLKERLKGYGVDE